jgi:hypothetical protein
MLTYDYWLLKRAAQLEEAAFDRWLRRVGPLQTAEGRLGRRLIDRAKRWFRPPERVIRCRPALPECGLRYSA